MSGRGSGRARGRRELGHRDAHTRGRGGGLGSHPRPVPSRGSNGLHVVGGEHPRVPRALHRAVHPPVVDLLHVDDGVAVLEGNFILIGRVVIVDGAETLLRGERGQWAQTPPGPLQSWAKCRRFSPNAGAGCDMDQAPASPPPHVQNGSAPARGANPDPGEGNRGVLGCEPGVCTHPPSRRSVALRRGRCRWLLVAVGLRWWRLLLVNWGGEART